MKGGDSVTPDLTSVDYCECGHMLMSHKETRWFDEVMETEIILHPCTHPMCSCVQYVHKTTMYFENAYVQVD